MITIDRPPRGPRDRTHDDDRVAILYENDAWIGPLLDRLARRGVPTTAVRLDDAAVWLDAPPGYPLIFNRVSPSSYVRGHGPAIPLARVLLDLFDADGRRLINGRRSFGLETSKVAQHLLFDRLGVASPRTLLFNNHDAVRDAMSTFPFPAVLKPNCGGSGALVRAIDDAEALERALAEDDTSLFSPDHLLLLQERLEPADGTIVRLEFIDGALVYAMRARPTNTFNLCPADACERRPARADGEMATVTFEPDLDIAPDAVAQAREIVRAADLDVGGVEFIETSDGTRWFFDINATSVYRDDVSDAWQVDALGMLVDFIEREYTKERAKRRRPSHRRENLSAEAWS